jgi:hypothetical protein
VIEKVRMSRTFFFGPLVKFLLVQWCRVTSTKPVRWVLSDFHRVL